MSTQDPMQISEGELRHMTADLEDMHHETLPQMHEGVEEWREEQRSLREQIGSIAPSRRGFLVGGAAALGGLALVACGSSSNKKAKGTAQATTPATSSGGGGLATDLKVSALAVSLENLAVQVYQAGIDAATAGMLGAVPPAVVTFAQTAQMQHKDHAAAWNAILTGANKPSVSGVDLTVKNAVTDPAFAKVKDVAGLANLALQLENVAAATYLSSIGVVTSAGGIKTSASIHPVELQHAAILNFVLGKYPVPDTFAKTDGARGLSDKIG